MAMTAVARVQDSRPAKVAKLDEGASVIVQLVSDEGDRVGTQLQLPHQTTPQQLETLINGLLKHDEKVPYAFYVDGAELSGEIGAAMVAQSISVEKVVDILYRPQAVFRVRPVGRCSATMAGHKEAVLSAHFSPDGRRLATGSGDATVQFWDLSTQLRARAGVAHATWVMVVAWAPDAGTLVSGDKAGVIHVWDAEGGDKSRGACKGHSKWITALAWRPAHLQLPATRFVSASKDGTVRVWEASSRQQLLCLGGHSATVNAVVWSGDDTIISGSNDREIRVWNAEDGCTIRVLHGHAHWVNALALSCAHVLRTGAYDHTGQRHASDAAAQAAARKRYDEATGGQPERLVSASDDHTLFLWTPMRDKKPICRLTGHQQLVNHVEFSPDGRWLLSASFDKSVRVWDGRTGKFVATLRGHVGPVYRVSWSSDSRMFVSASKDSTLKVWDLRTKKLKAELPGHEDEVFAVDWSPDGATVASGGKDKVVKLWRH